MNTPITRAEHEEFRRAMQSEHEKLVAEDTRLSKRLSLVEEETRHIDKLATSIETLAQSVETIAGRIKVLEDRDGEKWRKVTGYITTAVISLVLGFIAAKIGLQ